MKKILLIFCILFLSVYLNNSFSQEKPDLNNKKSNKLPQLKNLPSKGSFVLPKNLSLFNPERFKMSQSYSMFFSSGRNGGMRGMYENTINYKMSDKLNLRLNFGYMFQPGFINSKKNSASNFNNGIFLPNFDLTYRPSKNTFLNFSYRTYTPGLMYSPYYNNSRFNDFYHYNNDWFGRW